MARIPHGAEQLIAQVRELMEGEVEVELSDLDGLNVYRTIKFDKDTSEQVAPLFDQFLDTDERIQEWTETEAGYVYITFVGTPNADWRTAYPLWDALAVVNEEPSSDSEPDEPTPSDVAYPAAGTIADVKAWVGDNTERAAHALYHERDREKPRKSLADWLALRAEF